MRMSSAFLLGQALFISHLAKIEMVKSAESTLYNSFFVAVLPRCTAVQYRMSEHGICNVHALMEHRIS